MSVSPYRRISVFLAREAPVGAILWRKSHKWVRLIKWKTNNDEFELGHWFKGTIYENCALSPDGNRFIYCALKGKYPYPETWMAISKLPWLTALVFWPLESRHIGTIGFMDNHTICLPGHFEPRNSIPHQLRVIERCPDEMKDTGWKYLRTEYRREGLEWFEDYEVLCSKPHPFTHIKLIRSGAYREPRAKYRYYVHDSMGHAVSQINEAEWADWDQSGRLIYASQDKLYASVIDDQARIRRAKQLMDFNGQEPEPIEPPEWAKVW